MSRDRRIGRSDQTFGIARLVARVVGLAVADAAVMDDPLLVEAPDLEVHEPYIEIFDRQSDMHVVTVIELVSPSNKYSGPGRELYLTKQKELRWSRTHLVEIDLLRFGPHVLAVPEA